jgi:hypothetical protein
MVQTRYDFPLPNDGERYNLSQEELVKILDHVYECGFENARNAYDPSRQGVTSWASYNNSKEWKEVKFYE